MISVFVTFKLVIKIITNVGVSYELAAPDDLESVINRSEVNDDVYVIYGDYTFCSQYIIYYIYKKKTTIIRN